MCCAASMAWLNRLEPMLKMPSSDGLVLKGNTLRSFATFYKNSISKRSEACWVQAHDGSPGADSKAMSVFFQLVLDFGCGWIGLLREDQRAVREQKPFCWNSRGRALQPASIEIVSWILHPFCLLFSRTNQQFPVSRNEWFSHSRVIWCKQWRMPARLWPRWGLGSIRKKRHPSGRFYQFSKRPFSGAPCRSFRWKIRNAWKIQIVTWNLSRLPVLCTNLHVFKTDVFEEFKQLMKLRQGGLSRQSLELCVWDGGTD